MEREGKIMDNFTLDNTEGYTRIDCDAMQTAFNAILARVAHHDQGWWDLCGKSYRDYVSERVFVRYDHGLRGDDLAGDV
jgi:hypothetical protein